MNAAEPHADASVQTLKGVGTSLAGHLERLGVRTVQDLLFHLPMRYEDRTRVVPIGSLTQGSRAVIEGEVLAADVAFGRRRSLLVMLGDNSGRIGLRFFHFSKAQQQTLQRQRRLRCYGEVRRGASGLELYHPEYQFDQHEPLENTLTPVYPLTEGITQARLRGLVKQALDLLERHPPDDHMPVDLLPGLPSLAEALRFLHHPPSDADLQALADGRHPAQQRLAIEELTAHQLGMRRLRRESDRLLAWSCPADGRSAKQFLADLPFRLTGAQQRVAGEVADDLAATRPMMRLVQGDVGCGKTVVAALAALAAVDAGLQVAVMAPTELLAEQHLINFSTWFLPLGIPVAWLSGKVKGRSRDDALGKLEQGAAGVVVGTHALFQDAVSFARLGLVVIDEQHRFGVHQRLALRNKGVQAEQEETRHPHQLIMTATPIPRTLAMLAYGNLDKSVIDELPPGRTPITTTVINDERRAAVVERVRSHCARGVQAYWVCTLIEESEALQCQAAETTAAALAEALPELRVGLLHGRQNRTEKTRLMQEFKSGHIELLVATTVIEVGVDVPNASLMIIENAERLGLSQLHQLRGRVGRGQVESYCVLLYHAPLSATARQRLGVLRESNDGFRIAEKDLQLRGPGEVLGTRQTGDMAFHIVDLVRDSDLLDQAAAIADRLQGSAAEADLIRRWLQRQIELARA